MESVLSIRDVYRASSLLDDRSSSSPNLDLATVRGRLTELCGERGHPQVTLAVDLIAQAHQGGEPAAWIGSCTSLFYPPDATDWNLDWSALAFIQLQDTRRLLRGADKLLRSGAFGLVVIDLVGLDHRRLSDPLMGRLLRLAKTHDSAVVFLTQRPPSAPSISSLVSLRTGARWLQIDPARLRSKFTIAKDKRRGPGRTFCEVYDGPLGLC